MGRIVRIGAVAAGALSLLSQAAHADRPAPPPLYGYYDLRIDFSNAGALHDKITHLTLSQDGKVLAEQAQNYYVLAGAQRTLAWPGALKDAHGGAVELKVSLEGRNRSLSQTITVGPKG